MQCPLGARSDDDGRALSAPVKETDAIAFVLALGRALHRYGTPAHRLEEALLVICRRLTLEVEVFTTPTAIIMSFGEPTELRTRMMRVEGGELDMDKLEQVDDLADDVAAQLVTPAEGVARLDAILYGDTASLQIAGVTGFFEGHADLRLFSETHKREIAQDNKFVEFPGQVGNGFNAFDATFIPDYSVAARDGELLSIGFINGNGDYSRLGCFQYCNNLSGLSSCTGGPRSCPLQ